MKQETAKGAGVFPKEESSGLAPRCVNVMGTCGIGGFKNLVIGSVAQKVVTYSKVPVLVVK